jgi:hypothetical protein
MVLVAILIKGDSSLAKVVPLGAGKRLVLGEGKRLALMLAEVVMLGRKKLWRRDFERCIMLYKVGMEQADPVALSRVSLQLGP